MEHAYWVGLDLENPGEDRAAIASIGSAVTYVIADLLHHEMGDVSEGWSADHEPEVEIARLRSRLGELGTAVATAQRNLRHLEILRTVRSVWSEAFAAGGVADHQEDRGDTDQLNLEGVADALACAERSAGHDRKRLLTTQDLVGLTDQIFGRIVDTEHPAENDERQEEANILRAQTVAGYFVDHVLLITGA